jgi:hypothetical protein
MTADLPGSAEAQVAGRALARTPVFLEVLGDRLAISPAVQAGGLDGGDVHEDVAAADPDTLFAEWEVRGRINATGADISPGLHPANALADGRSV